MPPPIDDEERINGELQALAAELDRVVDGRNPNRGAGRELARKYRALHDSVRDHTVLKFAVGVSMVAAAERVTRALGTSAWDEPEGAQEVLERMAPLPAAPGSLAEDMRRESQDLIRRAEHHTGAGPAKVLSELEAAYGELRKAQPLTDDDLDAVEARAAVGIPPTTRDLLAYASGLRAAVPRLVAEVRRLRSDEWLVDASAEISAPVAGESNVLQADILAILRKHRDGKA